MDSPLGQYVASLSPSAAASGSEGEENPDGRGVRPYEVPISYRARSRKEGKKLTWRDGVEAVWILARLRAGR